MNTPTIDLVPAKTAAAGTAFVQLTQTATAWTPTPALPSTHTPFPTASPFPPKIASLLGTKCERFGETIYNPFMSLYEDKGCKLPMLSPDGAYLAYVTLTSQEDEKGVNFVDVVRILQVDARGEDKEVQFAHKLDYIVMLEWSPTDQLIIFESIWEGPWVVFIYDPKSNVTLTTMRMEQGGTLQWNPQHSAFYATHTGEYGADSCVGELGGYDFESTAHFPDIYKVFNVMERGDDPFGISYGKDDNLYIDPFAWSKDGKRLWLTISFLKWQGDPAYRYEVGPKQAGVLEFSATGIVFTPLATDPHFDYSFEGSPEPKIVSQVYQPRFCP